MSATSNLFEAKRKLDCNICKHQRTGGYKLKCGHDYCMKCFQHLLFTKCIHNIKDLDLIKIECSCCDSKSSFIPLEEVYDFLVKNVQYEILPLEDERCNDHPTQLTTSFCKTCETEICDECKTSSNHQSHEVCNKHMICGQINNDLKNIPLRYKNLDHFLTHFNDITKKFKEEVEISCKTTISSIDLLIKELNDLKINFAKMIKERLARGVLLMKIIKLFYANYYMNFENKTKISDVFTLRYLRNIHYEFADLKIEMEKFITEEINDIIKKSNELKDKTKCFLKIQVDYQETAGFFTQETKLDGHNKEVTAIIKLQDGGFVTGGADYTIRFWELKGDVYENTATIKEYTGFVMGLYQLKDKRIISTERDSNNTRIWDNASGEYKCSITLKEHTQYVTSLIQLADEKLITASKDSHICIWEKSKELFTCKMHLTEHQNGVYALVELDGNKIASGGDDKTIKIWEGNNDFFSCVQILGGHTQRVKTLAKFIDESGRFVSGGDDCFIKVWEPDKGGSYRNIISIEAHHKTIMFLTILNDARILSASKDKSIRIWQIVGNELTRKEVLKGHSHVVFGAIELDEGKLASCGGDTIIIWKKGSMQGK
jgi:WD40 repeat protein